MSLYQQGVTLKALLENPDLLNPPKLNRETKEKKDGELVDNDLFLGQSAFLGPTIWEKTLDVSDFKLEYMDLDEFLNENGLVDGNEGNDKKEVAAAPPLQQQQQPQQQQETKREESPAKSTPVEPQLPSVDLQGSETSPPSSPGVHIDFEVPEGDISLVTIPGQEFDPKKRAFSEEELRPQPMIKKSKKIFVPEDLKDDRYWQRRKKNNVAAKRSRDARRIKENQIAMRAAFLERENDKFREDLEKMKNENKILKSRLVKYEPDFTL